MNTVQPQVPPSVMQGLLFLAPQPPKTMITPEVFRRLFRSRGMSDERINLAIYASQVGMPMEYDFTHYRDMMREMNQPGIFPSEPPAGPWTLNGKLLPVVTTFVLSTPHMTDLDYERYKNEVIYFKPKLDGRYTWTLTHDCITWLVNIGDVVKCGLALPGMSCEEVSVMNSRAYAYHYTSNIPGFQSLEAMESCCGPQDEAIVGVYHDAMLLEFKIKDVKTFEFQVKQDAQGSFAYDNAGIRVGPAPPGLTGIHEFSWHEDKVQYVRPRPDKVVAQPFALVSSICKGPSLSAFRKKYQKHNYFRTGRVIVGKAKEDDLTACINRPFLDCGAYLKPRTIENQMSFLASKGYTMRSGIVYFRNVFTPHVYNVVSRVLPSATFGFAYSHLVASTPAGKPERAVVRDIIFGILQIIGPQWTTFHESMLKDAVRMMEAQARTLTQKRLMSQVREIIDVYELRKVECVHQYHNSFRSVARKLSAWERVFDACSLVPDPLVLPVAAMDVVLSQMRTVDYPSFTITRASALYPDMPYSLHGVAYQLYLREGAVEEMPHYNVDNNPMGEKTHPFPSTLLPKEWQDHKKPSDLMEYVVARNLTMDHALMVDGRVTFARVSIEKRALEASHPPFEFRHELVSLSQACRNIYGPQPNEIRSPNQAQKKKRRLEESEQGGKPEVGDMVVVDKGD